MDCALRNCNHFNSFLGAFIHSGGAGSFFVVPAKRVDNDYRRTVHWHICGKPQVQAARTVHGDIYAMRVFSEVKVHFVIATFGSFALTIIGTLIWGYGDLIYSWSFRN